MEEVAKHTSRDSCWLVVRGKVYDVTRFIPDHPGSANAILKHAGTDSTEDFDFHSDAAKGLWDKFHIGYTHDYKESWCAIS